MRKFFALGLLALLLGLFSISAFAGNAAECDYLKDKEDNPEHPDYEYQPGLYGLCIAWHNADEEARVALGEKFLERAGFEVPGSESGLQCPCWKGVVLEDIEGQASPFFCDDGSVVWASFQSGPVLREFIADGVDCLYETESHVVLPGASFEEEDGELCLNEVLDILDYYWPDGCFN